MAAITGPDYGTAGLISGFGNLAQGINQGLITYQNQQNIKYNQKMEEALTGMQQNDDGSFSPTPQRQQQMELQSQLQARQLHEMDPNSAESQSARELNRGLLQTIPNFKGDVNSLVPDTASAADLKENNPLEKASVAGMYGMLGQQVRGNAMQQMVDVRKEGLDLQKHKTATGAVINDKPTENLISGYQSMQNALTEFNNNPSPQSLHTLQNVMRMNAGSSNRSGVNERADQYATDLGISKDTVMQIITGQMQDVNLSSPEMVNAVKKVIGGEIALKQQQGAQRIKQTSGSYTHSYDKPSMTGYKQDLGNTISGEYDQLGLDANGQPKQGLLNQGASQDPKITQYAQQNGLDYAHAAQILKARGYNGQQ